MLPLLLSNPVISFLDIVVMCLVYISFATLINLEKAFKVKSQAPLPLVIDDQHGHLVHTQVFS
jgi:hypothetical protein